MHLFTPGLDDMIARIWHGRTLTTQAVAYRQYVLATGIPDYQATPGNLGVQLWQRPAGEITHIWTVSWWPDEASIIQFAGPAIEQARYYPDDSKYLLEQEPTVQHCTVTGNAFAQGTGPQIARQFVELFEGGNWLDESFRGKLADLSDETAFTQPGPGVHSVAELVAHCIYWRRAVAARVGGDLGYATSMENPGNWPALDQLRAQGWPALWQELIDTQTQLVQALSVADEAWLQREYTPGKTLHHLVEGLLAHDVYHLGQIGLVLRMISPPL
jgi:uncharacterized damage-inducible protein DinB